MGFQSSYCLNFAAKRVIEMQVSEAVSAIVWMIFLEQGLLVQLSYLCSRKVAHMPA